MLQLTYRIKLFALLIAFAVFTGLMFTYGYGIMDSRNQAQLDSVNKQNLELLVLKKEQVNFEQGKKDIAALSQKTFPPQDLFSKDTKVVKEIKILEDLAKQYGLEFDLQVSGTTKNAVKVPEISGELFLVPYTVNVTGPFAGIQKYVEMSEHTSFINQTQNITLQALNEGRTRATLKSVFYLKP